MRVIFYFFECSILESLEGAKSISVLKREREHQRHRSRNESGAATPVVVFYVKDAEYSGRPTNLNEELVLLGHAHDTTKPLPPVPDPGRPRAWKPNHRLPEQDDVVFGNVTSVNEAGVITFQDARSEWQLKDLHERLHAKYADSEPSEEDLRCQPGDICIAKYNIFLLFLFNLLLDESSGFVVTWGQVLPLIS